MSSIEELAAEWLRLDKDMETHDEIQQLLADDNRAELEERLRTRIAFGTAGLMQAGFSSMNSLTVIQASQGLAEYLTHTIPNATKRGVVIGWDARHRSAKFASLVAAVFYAKGFKILWLSDIVHTPLVPFAVTHVKAAAGVMITASHNPAKDNGYKVYWSNGSQIIPPHDAGIAASIMENLDPIESAWTLESVDRASSLWHDCRDSITKSYNNAIEQLVQPLKALSPTIPLRFVYTPMHGVGEAFMRPALHNVAHSEGQMVIVPQQAKPDPTFPTVKFPNPEEKGALDLAIATAEANNIILILANDPDADRFAFAEKVKGKWYQLTGNEIGALFASVILDAYPKNADISRLAMFVSTVSSRMLAVMAEKEGFHFQETLTGFKWLGNVAQEVQAQEYDAVYAFEEAIGYMFSRVVWDKDGIAAATVFLTACSHWMSMGLTPWSQLQQLYEKYGRFHSANTYLLSPSPTTTTAIFTHIRALSAPYPYPTHLGTRRIIRWRDLTTGFDSATPGHAPALPTDPTTQIITIELDGAGQVRATMRASGTEPKIKFYVEGRADSERVAKKAAEEVLEALLGEESWFGGEEWGIRRA
ncbi:hypothetical protein B0A49_03804 [Cryomyces minteri]|uniref:Phosphoribomutase n=1 Tax=Cryomyces minteri TaxID=331657 RepID=A0A4U0X6B9_9PEZI|nr:hypothetical protein B0A49_03804 [Cryomyces minteri]